MKISTAEGGNAFAVVLPGSVMFSYIDKMSDWAGRLAAWLFFLIGGFIVYEVVARYVFLSPTIWSEEMSRFLQIWATYLAGAYVLRKRQLIAIDIVTHNVSPMLRKVLESIALMVVIAFCLIAIVFGVGIVVDSIKVGRFTSSMLAVPSWMIELAIPVGFGLMLVQALVELVRTITGTGANVPSRH